jgi:hypothetical protein
VAGAILALLALSVTLAAGCDEEVQKEFRGAAVGSIETGMKALMDGILDGLFAVAEPNADGGAADATSGGTGG